MNARLNAASDSYPTPYPTCAIASLDALNLCAVMHGPVVDTHCIATLAARIVQSGVHISHEQTNAFVAVRFSFYSVQRVSFLALIVTCAKRALTS